MDRITRRRALIFMTAIAFAIDAEMTDSELVRIGQLVERMPTFDDYDDLVAEACAEFLAGDGGIERACATSAKRFLRPYCAIEPKSRRSVRMFTVDPVSDGASAKATLALDAAVALGVVSLRLDLRAPPRRFSRMTLAPETSSRWLHAYRHLPVKGAVVDDFGQLRLRRAAAQDPLRAAGPARKLEPRLSSTGENDGFPGERCGGRKNATDSVVFDIGLVDRQKIRPSPRTGLSFPSSVLERRAPGSCFPTSKAANAPSFFPDEGCKGASAIRWGAGTNRAARLA